jgi:hypothetical protein
VRRRHLAKVAGLLAVVLVAVGAGAFVRRRAREAREARILQADIGATCPDARALGDRCGRCIAAFCCKEMQACYGSPDCIDLNDCYVRSGEDEGQGGSPATRAATCLKEHEVAVTSFLAWDGCARKNCEDICPRGPEED